MDIQISSNFERLLFEAVGRDGAAVARHMDQFKQSGGYTVDPKEHAAMLGVFSGQRLDDPGTLKFIGDVHRASGYVLDPHSAVGLYAARKAGLDSAIPRIALATAHPAKFPDAVEKATGTRPSVPAALAEVFQRREHFTTLPNDLDQVRRLIRDRVSG